MSEEEMEVTEEEEAPTEFYEAPIRDNPYVTEEMQGMEMTPQVMGPPPYGSPDPTSSQGRLLSIKDHPLADQISEDYGQVELTDLESDSMGGGDDAPAADGENATAGAVELANAEGVNLADVTGTGAGGRVTKADVENFLANQ